MEKLGKVDSYIDGWINFAVEKQVKVFELDLGPGGYSDGFLTNYSIPHVQKLLSICGEVKLLTALSTLKSFRFVNIRLTQEIVEFLLSHCPLLEEFCISASFSLLGLEVTGSLVPKLRSLEISGCDTLKTMKVHDAPGLVSCTYIGPAVNVPFKKVPLLSELTIGGYYADSFIMDAHKHSRYSRNLKKLTLEVSLELSMTWSVVPDEFPQLCNLKELELNITTEEDVGLCFFAFLTKCSPQLSRLTIKLFFSPGLKRCIDKDTERNFLKAKMNLPDDVVIERMRQALEERRSADRDAREATTFCHKSLEVVKFVGFIGCEADYNLASHLLRIARSSLMKMIIDTKGNPISSCRLDKKAVRKCARQLKENLPAGAELLTCGPGFTRKLAVPE